MACTPTNDEPDPELTCVAFVLSGRHPSVLTASPHERAAVC